MAVFLPFLIIFDRENLVFSIKSMRNLNDIYIFNVANYKKNTHFVLNLKNDQNDRLGI